MIVIPSILSDSIDDISRKLEIVRSAGVDAVHIDCVDPSFEDVITIDPIDLVSIPLLELEIDIHLMRADPILDVVECSQIKGIRTIIAQIERMSSQAAYIDHVESFGIDSGLSLDFSTPIESLDRESLERVSMIQVMANYAGRQRQEFRENPTMQKIEQLVTLRKKNSYSYRIAVDIGMTPTNAALVATAGADIVTPGSFLFESRDFKKALAQYQ